MKTLLGDDVHATLQEILHIHQQRTEREARFYPAPVRGLELEENQRSKRNQRSKLDFRQSSGNRRPYGR